MAARRSGRGFQGNDAMIKNRMFLSTFTAMSLVMTSGCVTDPNTGDKKVSRTAIGAVGGAVAGLLVGGLLGGSTGRIIGAGIGAGVGGFIGYRKDQQIRELKEQTAGSGVDVTAADDGKSIMLNLPENVTFDSGRSALKPEFRGTLDGIADNLKKYPNSLIDVYGHTDTMESEANSQSLSDARARTVANYLTTRGVSAARIRSQGFGETMPVASNETAEGRARNRRVEVKIVPISEEEARAAHQQH